jgi:uncharacterized protein YpiB (UPF0302 family)
MIDTNTSDPTVGTEPTPEINNETPQNPIEAEIQKETKRNEVRTEAEKAAFSLKKNAERAKELGIDPAEVLGFTGKQAEPQELDKNAPLTIAMYEQLQKQTAQKTALQLADSIPDEHERTLVKEYLKNRIVPSGDSQEDLRFARLAVNSLKNEQIVAELSRGVQPKGHSSAPSAPPKSIEQAPELTAQELQFTRPPFNLTPQQIISMRK